MPRRLFIFLFSAALLIRCSAPTPPPTLTLGATPTRAAVEATLAAPTSAPAAAATPAPNITPTASPTPKPVLKQLTSGGCCVQPFWSADSQKVLFIDKPSATAPIGIYAVDVTNPATPELFSPRVAYYTSDLKYAIYFEGDDTVVEQVSTGVKAHIRNGRRSVALSPDRTRLVWNQTPETYPLENRVTTVTLANSDGTNPHPLTTVLRGGASGWLDNQRLLMTGRASPSSREIRLFIYSIPDGKTQELVRSEHLRSVVPNRSGDWIAYTIVFDQDTAQNGMWLVRTDGSAPHKLNFFGAFQWRDDARIVCVPLEAQAASHIFYEYDTRTDTTRVLTPPATPAFKIANGDWAISPDGNKIVFVNAHDMNLWLLDIDGL